MIPSTTLLNFLEKIKGCFFESRNVERYMALTVPCVREESCGAAKNDALKIIPYSLKGDGANISAN